MMPVEGFIIIFFAHFIADFAVQTRDQAMRKSSELGALVSHVTTYGLSFFMLCLPLLWLEVSPEALAAFVAVNCIFHFATDFCTSRMAKAVEFASKPFWLIIGFDQFLHTAAFMLTLEVLCQ